MAEIRLRVSVEGLDADPNALDEAIRSLTQEVDLVPAARIDRAGTGVPPEGSRGVDAASVQAILVSIPAAITAIQSLLSVLRAWQRRRRPVGTSSGALKVRLGDDVLELETADEETTARVVEAWLAAHPANE